MSTELTWVLMVVWFVVTTSAIGELSYAWIVSRKTTWSLRKKVQTLTEQAHCATANCIGTVRAIMSGTHDKLGVLAAQTPRQVRRDPRAEPGGNLTDPY